MADTKTVTVKTETAPEAPAAVPTAFTFEQVLEIVRTAVAANAMDAEKVAEISATAAATAHQKVNQWWDDRTYHEKSVFNPEGDKANPRPLLTRQIFWVGYPLQEAELKRPEIELLNELKPGIFPLTDEAGQVERPGFWHVRDLDPGIPNGRYLVLFPCSEPDQRSLLARFDRGRGMVDLLRQMVPQTASAAA